MKSMTCPNCGGNQSSSLGEGKFKCLYCGTTFNVAEEIPQKEPVQQPATGEQPQVIYVQTPPPPIFSHPSYEL